MERFAKSRQYEKEEFIDVEKGKKASFLGGFLKIILQACGEIVFLVKNQPMCVHEKNEDQKDKFCVSLKKKKMIMKSCY